MTDFDVSGAMDTTPAGLDAKGTITGTYDDSSGNVHGFVRTASVAMEEHRAILGDRNRQRLVVAVEVRRAEGQPAARPSDSALHPT